MGPNSNIKDQDPGRLASKVERIAASSNIEYADLADRKICMTG
jgi:hypothetical protein